MSFGRRYLESLLAVDRGRAGAREPFVARVEVPWWRRYLASLVDVRPAGPGRLDGAVAVGSDRRPAVGPDRRPAAGSGAAWGRALPVPRQPSPRPVAAGPAPSRRRNPGRRLVGVIAAELLPSGVSYTLIPSTHGRPAPLPSGDCAGSSRTRITSAKTGLPLGLADADRSAGSPVVLDGIARYGWVSTHSGPHWRYNACTADGPSLVQNADDTVSLGRGGPEPDIWTVEPAADPGTYTIVGRGGCVTAGIPGRQVKVQECVAGDAAQQWRLSDIG